MTIHSDTPVGTIAAQHPMATRVFARHGIDFCCGGGIALQQACDKLDIDTHDVLAEIEQTLADLDSEFAEERWDQAPVAQLVHHIVDTYHAPLREELPRLEFMARKVARVHGARDPQRLGALLETFLQLKDELEEHLQQEEEVLFPMILENQEDAAVAVASIVDDHVRTGLELARLRELTDDFRVPEGACNTWNALWHGLAALDQSLREHIHLENNVLFPQLKAA